MDGYQYEKRCAKFLQENGFSDITVTSGSGDQGIDVIACKDGKKYGIQCKYYTGAVGNKAVQEAYAGAAYYECDIAMVITNSVFSKPATELALRLNVILQENIDAISLYQSNEQLTFEEKEALEVERIERLLREKYRSLRAKFPEIKNNDTEISFYIEEIQSKLELYKKDDQNLDRYHSERYHEFLLKERYHLSDSERKRKEKAFDHDTAEKYRQRDRRNRELLEQVNYDLKKFVAIGISEASVKKLIALFRKVYLNAGSPNAIKYYRMVDKWKTLEDSLPSVIEKRDKEAEKLAIQSAQKKLTSIENEIQQLRTTLKNNRTYNKKLTALSDLQQELRKLKKKKKRMNCDDELAELKANYQKEQDQYQRNILELDTEIATKDDQIRRAQIELTQMLFFSFKKKNEKKDVIFSLEEEKSSLELHRKGLIAGSEENTNFYKNSAKNVRLKFDTDKAEMEKRIEDLKKKITQYERDIEEEKPEKRQKRLSELEAMLPMLQREAKDARKNYLLETYRNL